MTLYIYDDEKRKVVVEAVSRALAPDAWADDLPIPTRADTMRFHARRHQANHAAKAAVSALEALMTPLDDAARERMVDAAFDVIDEAQTRTFGSQWNTLGDVEQALDAALAAVRVK